MDHISISQPVDVNMRFFHKSANGRRLSKIDCERGMQKREGGGGGGEGGLESTSKEGQVVMLVFTFT